MFIITNVLTVLMLLSSLLCECSKILVVSPLPVKSHVILGNAYVKLLLRAGHKVTHITSIPYNISHSNLRRIDVTNYYYENLPSADNPRYFARLVTNLFISTLKHEEVDRLLKDTRQNFDLIIAEWMFNDVYAGISALYDCPILWFSATESHWMMLRMLEDNRNSDAYKIQNVPHFVSSYVMNNMYLYNLEKEAYENVFKPLMALRGKHLLPYDETKCFESFVLIYLNVLPEEAGSLPRTFKPVAGFHIDNEVEPLPKDLKSIMDNAKHGVIYFSMGSNLNSKQILGVHDEILLDVFSKLKQTVLWRYESTFPRLPLNVHVMKWAPQQSILSHTNCILFVTQGGVLSSTEALHFGVPLIGIPILADQFTNIERAVEKGYAIEVQRTNSMPEHLKEAINEIIRNPKYRTKAKESSFIYHNRSTPAYVEIVHWANQAIQSKLHIYSRKKQKKDTLFLYKNIYLDFGLTVTLILILIYLVVKRLLKSPIKKRVMKSNYKL